MNPLELLTTRNRQFAATHFDAGLTLMPRLKTMIIGCVDPRVDPVYVLGLEQGRQR